MARIAVFVDGGYLNRIAIDQFGKRIDYSKLADAIQAVVRSSCQEPVDTLRTYYYDCLPYQSTTPTKEEADRFSGKQRFFAYLNRLPRFSVREGRLKFRGLDKKGLPVFEQKRVDLLLGLDFALLAGKRQVSYFALLAGDGDFLPAVRVAQQEGVLVWLFHGPSVSKIDGNGTYAVDLWNAADERREIDQELVDNMSETSRPKTWLSAPAFESSKP